jgi:hypothetical protein
MFSIPNSYLDREMDDIFIKVLDGKKLGQLKYWMTESRSKNNSSLEWWAESR